MNSIPWAILTVVAFAFIVVFAALGGVFVARLVRRPTMPLSEQVGGIPTVLRKLKKREPMTEEEIALARQAVYDRGSLMALCIPATIFSIGCFYVFGSLDYLHGATPSERTFLGVIPMFTSTNLFIRMVMSASLRRRLPKPQKQAVAAAAGGSGEKISQL
jgi:Kef-type K+ transport system membrane component KefB